MSLREQLISIDISILQSILSRDDLNINSEHEVIFFLNYYYTLHQDNKIDTKLIPNIRMLTLSNPEIDDVSNLLLAELPTYKKFIDRASKGDIFSKAYLIINYSNISIPRNSVVIVIFNKRPEIANYHFGEQLTRNFNPKLPIFPIFPAIVMNIDSERGLTLRIINDIILAEINEKINMPKTGSMILIVDSIMISELITNRNRNTNMSFNTCLINKYDVIFEHVPKIFYK